jgi:2-methylcitrate dehydratase PrpD
MLLRALADRIAEVSFEALPGEAVATAKQGILDTVGVTLAGARDDTTAVVTRALRWTAGQGAALIFGGSESLDALSAALINGTASHALDFDDCSNTLGGHPSAPILPALWTLATGVSGQAFIAAYAAGVETECKLARAVNFHHYDKGWHPTATLGTFGAAAACAHLLRLSPDKIATALALAASMASRNGLFAALLAEEGMTANHGALEHKQGFFAVFNGEGNFDADRILAEWAKPFDLADPGIAFKRHPCCGSTHPAADAMLDLRATHTLAPERVERIESWTHPRRLQHTNRPDPQSGLDGKFSVQYVLARALMHGIVSLEHFSDAAVRDDDARALMAKVNAQPDDSLGRSADDHFYARVQVTTASGETHEHFVERPLGRDRDHPLPEGTLEAKFRDCARRALDEASTEEVLRLCGTLDELADVGDVLTAMTHTRSVEPLDARRAYA